MGEGTNRFRRELAAELRGSRSARRRLMEEIDSHLAETVAERGEEEALARLGDAGVIASGWNALQRRKRRRVRRTVALGSVTLACTVALGVTQYASGGSDRPRAHCSTSNSSPTSGSLPIRSRISPGIAPEKEMSPNRSDGSCEIQTSPSGNGGS